MSDTSPDLLRREHLRHPTQILLLLLACVLFALVQLTWAGYQLGFGNQAIQIPFLEALRNPALFTRDSMVTTTLGEFPSLFFRLCAKLLTFASLPTLYLTLHFLATFLVFIVVAAMARSIGGDHWAALIAMLLILAGQHEALAGESLYSEGFTHTWAVFPLSLLALVLFFRRRYWLTFILIGVIFNFHALEAGYLALLFGLILLLDVRRTGFSRLVGYGAACLVAASPTLALMVMHHQSFDAQWLQLMHIRSADHSFPFTWWKPGSANIPRLACIIAMAGIALTFPLRPSMLRKILLLAAGIGALFVIGTVFTEWIPIPIVIRAQFFRSSRFLMMLALVVIAHGASAALQLPFRHRSVSPPLSRGAAWLEFASALITVLAIAFPPFIDLIPAALLLAVITALVTGRLAWQQALVAGLALLVCLLAWMTIDFVIPGLTAGFTWKSLFVWRVAPIGFVLLIPAVLFWILIIRPLPRLLNLAVCALGLILACRAIFFSFPNFLRESAPDPTWVDVQLWSRDHTPTGTLFLTPPQQNGFRIYSQRAIVGEFRDGTQLYFSSAFAKSWWDRMKAMNPGMVLDERGLSRISPGPQIDALKDEQIVALAQHFGADYIVLPHSENHDLEKAYENKNWTIYRPTISAANIDTSDGSLASQDDFIKKIALPNIEKNRKSDARIQLLDAAGQPLPNAEYTVTQTSSSFGFGCSLPFFKASDVDVRGDYKPPPVTQTELSHFLETFNYSMILFSSQWRFIEPEQGKSNYADLDQYVDWCATHNIRPEFHFLAGYQPPWIKSKIQPEQSALTLAHARDMVRRYGNRITEWQVTCDKIGLETAPALFGELRDLNPKIQLGLSDDARFWSARTEGARDRDMLRGLDDLRDLKKKGAHVDFFSLEARRPVGLWADAKDTYATLDAYAKEGVRLHISEFGVPLDSRIEGSVKTTRDGKDERWTPELQAAYYERFFTVCFSHPNVDVINVVGIGPTTWIENQGLLDDKGQPTPAFNVLKSLIMEKWRTHEAGKSALDGYVNFRGFHGNYEVSVRLPTGKGATATFAVAPGQPNEYRFRLDAAGTLSRVE